MDYSAEISKSWYTKYRPKNMEEYSGPAIKSIVEKRFTKRENMPHVIFIHGSRGCGKTTFARIISKYYLCQNLTEHGPCEECEMCQSINEILIDGNSAEIECPGVTELDATIMNGKEAIQEVLDDALQAPIYSDFKVLIVDECHMISNAGQNSMLKIIEDIPQHLVVIFATTDPQKVLQTIKSRCQLTLEVRKQSVEDMAARLMYIATKEGLVVDTGALEVIAKKGDRVPRECINKLEEIARAYDGRISIDNIREYFGSMSSDLYMNYFNSCGNLSSIMTFIKDLNRNNTKISDFVSGLIGFVLDALYIKHGISLDEYPPEFVSSMKQFFKTYESGEFDALLQIIEHMANSLEADNQTKNELLLVTTAMRISKVKLLASGLESEQREALTENKISLVEFAKQHRANNAELIEQDKLEVNTELLNETFEGMRQVNNSANIIDTVTVPQVEVPFDASDDMTSEKVKLGDEIDDFFNS